jgi:hypothetical protein
VGIAAGRVEQDDVCEGGDVLEVDLLEEATRWANEWLVDLVFL